MLGLKNQNHSLEGKANKQYNFFNLDYTQTSVILNELQYPKLEQYCYLCSKLVTQNNSLTCHLCFKSVHKLCIIPLGFPSLYICRFCVDKDICLKCKIAFFKISRKLKCSICLKNLHIQCWNMPYQLNQHTKKYYNHINNKMEVFNRIVCQFCQLIWGINAQKMMCATIQQKKYVLVQIIHPSPIHHTWIAQSQFNLIKQTRIQEEITILQSFSFVIENIFSIHLFSKYKSLSLGCLYKFLEETKVNDLINEKAFFLVKWQNREQLIWQTFQNVRPFNELIRKFFFQLNLNWMRSTKKQKQEIIRSIDYFMQDEQVYKKVNFQGNKIITVNQSKQVRNDFLERICELYSQSNKQSLITKDENDQNKFIAVCYLINTILFVKKQLKPIFLFTSKKNIKRWFSAFTKNCPFHKCLTLTGSQQYLQFLMFNHFRAQKQNKQMFYSNIYLFDYISFEKILVFYPFQQIIHLSTLVIMQEKISFFAKNFYDACRVAKIKLTVKNVENSSSFDLQNLSEKNIIQNQSSFNDNKKYYFDYIHQQFRQTQQQIENKYKNNYFYSQSQLNELQRLSFLRFIMLFGLQFENSQVFIHELVSFEKSVFLNEQITLIRTKLEIYTKKFLTILYKNLQKKQHSEQIIQFFCFNLEPYEIFERMIFINQLKKIVKKHIKDTKENKIQTYKIQDFSSSFEFNLMIFEAVVRNGFGKWEQISEYSKIWQQGMEETTFREYFCLKSTLNIHISGFCEVIIDRLLKFWKFLKTNNRLF